MMTSRHASKNSKTDSLEGRFDSVERRRDKERDELKRTIKELQDEVISLKRSISETTDYIDEKLEKASKLRKCSHICIEEEPVVLEVRRYVLGHGQVKAFTI